MAAGRGNLPAAYNNMQIFTTADEVIRPTVNMAVLGGFMKICEQLPHDKGITAVIGSGGKQLYCVYWPKNYPNGDFDDFTHILPFAGIPPVGDG